MRLADNPALSTAIETGEVIPTFVIDPVLMESDRVGPKRLAWLQANLRALDRSLRERGSRLIVQCGDPAAMLLRLAREAGAEQVYFNLDLTPYARARDRRVGLELEANGVRVESFDDAILHHPDDIVTFSGRPFQVFTAFKRAWLSRPKPSALAASAVPKRIESPEGIGSLPIDFTDDSVELPTAGEAAALDRLNAFLGATVFDYADGRNMLDRPGTSGLSPYLRFGALSIRQAYWGAVAAIDLAPDKPARDAAGAWLNELIWREVYAALLSHFPHTLRRPLRGKYVDFPWPVEAEASQSWAEGRPG